MSTGSDPHLTLAAWLSEEEGAEPPPPLGAVKLPRLTLREALTADADLVVGEVLGEGGMAVVRSARQVALDRGVAIKQSLSQDPAAVAGLVREAVIGAKLSHPNIVPVHFVGETDEGEPIVVMRKIGGVTWDALAEQDVARSRHLEVFHALCRALAYAHDAGFAHRDLKPSNVRIGDFGEIYLLDWGVAGALDDRTRAPAGTPAYMAPEARRPGPVDVRHDVFGLAASLLRVLTGDSAPRDGEGGLIPPAGLPEGLRRVLARAGAADPAARTPDVESLRREVAAWEEDREVEALRRIARDQEARLEEAEGLAAFREQFAITRFAWSSVLERRGDDSEARAGLARARDRMIDAELEGNHVEAAEGWLASHPAPDEAVRARVARARASWEATREEDERLKQVARAADLTTIRGIISRVVAAVLLSLMASMLLNRALLGPPSPGEPRETAWRLVGMAFLPWLTICAAATWYWRDLARSVAGQRAALGAVGFGTLFFFVRVATAAGGLLIDDRPGALAYEPIILVAFALGMANLSRRFLVAAGVGVLTWIAVIISFWNDAAITAVYNLSIFVTLATMVWAWEDVQRGGAD